ncbi:membrane integrity-associated transporter subunit PqiC [Shewanella frigidimarina]|uniref:PqiC family protein n=1 Tax=Shewanella frigidimarina TaxID=56812 RepID=UPI000F4E2BE8|nr:PqiC family protein [Shewanella frigidimarina]RPA61378.1 membrane integrity-associated transporter subunit PqiC [Shewanella frigidimarina]
MEKYGVWSINWGIGLLLLSLVSGCQSSPEKQYFVLTAMPSQMVSGSTALEHDIGIGPIDVAEYLHFTQLMYQLDDGSLQRFANSYWAEPLEQGISRVMSINLSQGDRRRNLVLFSWRANNTPQYSIKIKVTSLNRDGNNARLNANWELTNNSLHQTLAKQNFIAVTNAGSTAAELVSAYSNLLTQLAKEIEKSLPQNSD